MTRSGGWLVPGLLGYVIAGGVALAALGALYWAIDARAYQRGKADTEALWRAANEREEAKAAARRKAAAATVRELEDKASGAARRAEDYRARWQQERSRAASSGEALASCVAEGATHVAKKTQLEPAPSGRDPGGGTVRFTPSFVRLYDAAWTGERGESFFPDTGAAPDAAAPAGAAQPGPAEVLTNHEENAARCSADRRQLAELIKTVRELRARWEHNGSP